MRKTSNDELDRLDQNSFCEANKIPVVVILDNIRSQSNIGSFFRTCDAFRIEELVLCGITATPPHREIQKTALGATETVAWRYSPDTLEVIDDLRGKGYLIIGVEQAEPHQDLLVHEFDLSRPTALIFGNEVDGVSEEVMNSIDFALEIPQSGTKHSLNVAVSGGILLWETYKQYRMKNKNWK